jgi:nucleoside-diphosphate-sugar epimerase
MKLRILVTGGSGRIGQKLVLELKKAGYNVRILDLTTPMSKECEFVEGDLLDLESVKRAAVDTDTIVHLAAIPVDYPKDYKKLWDINITGTFHVLEAAVHDQVRKLIFASSICTLGIGFWKDNPVEIQYFPVDERHPTRPHDLYGLGKLIAEQLCYTYTKRFGIETICLRLASVCFTNPEGGPALGWVEEFERDIKPCIINPASCVNRPEKDWVWEYLDENDAVQAFLLAVKKDGIEHAVYNIGAADTPTELDSLELARLYYPRARIKKKAEFQANPKRALYDISRARKDLGYEPKTNWHLMSSKLFL